MPYQIVDLFEGFRPREIQGMILGKWKSMVLNNNKNKP